MIVLENLSRVFEMASFIGKEKLKEEEIELIEECREKIKASLYC